MVRYEFACGGFAADQPEHRILQTQGPRRNINLRVSDISKAMVSKIPDVLLDLVEIAAYVYCADQQTRRGTEHLTAYGTDWRREMIFHIPVRCHAIWQSEDVGEALATMLGFLSDEQFTFEFVPTPKPLARSDAYFFDLADRAPAPDEIALFSGGLDSFAGALAAQAGGKKVVLVGHHAAPKIFDLQKQLVEALNARRRRPRHLFVPVNVTNAGPVAVEYTQRTRSFLFASLGLVVARMYGKDELTFYENGVVSLNLPIAADVLGARATRTTHPRTIRGFERFFSLLLDREISVRTPFQWLTKAEVVRKIAENAADDLLAKTNSCTRTRAMTKEHRHCGVCSQCIDRRFAVLAASLGAAEPAESYQVDLLTGDRTHERDIRMAASYVKFARDFPNTPAEQFTARHPEITSALGHFDDTPRDAAPQRIYDMYMRHHEEVMRVLQTGAEKHRDQLVRGALPDGCLLSMLFNRHRVQIAEPSNYQEEARAFVDQLSKPVCEFAVDGSAGKIHFRGKLVLEGANLAVFHALLLPFRTAKAQRADVAFTRVGELAESLGIDEQSVRQQVGRLRKAVTEHLVVQLGLPLGQEDVIENRPGKGYRINPQLREVMWGDLEPGVGPMSHLP